MARIVMKFGGTSVQDIERIRNVADRVAKQVGNGDQVAVVISAMAGTTNQLIEWTREASPMHDAREYDAVVSVKAGGESPTRRISTSTTINKNATEMAPPAHIASALISVL